MRISVQANKSSTQMKITPVGSAEAIAECSGLCDFYALPGHYTLYTRNLTTGTKHEQALRIEGPRRYELDEGDADASRLGLTLGVAGSVAIFAGIVMTLPLAFSSMCEDTKCSSDDQRTTAAIGLGVLLAGAVMTPIGFTVASHNRRRLRPLEDEPYYYGSQRVEPSVRLGVVGVTGGLGLGGVATF